MAAIVVVTNRKGGVGKTTISTHIAAGLAARGWRVGLVDTDSQGHAGLMLGMVNPQTGRSENGLFKALVGKQPLEDLVQIVPRAHYAAPGGAHGGELYLLPSSDMTYRIPYEMDEYESFLFFETVERLIDLYQLDTVLVDTSPTISRFDGSVYLAADAYIYVTECELLAADGLQNAMQQMVNFQATRRKYLNRQSQVLGIVPNKMRPNTAAHRKNITEIGQAFPGMVWPPVTLRTAWVEAANSRLPVYVLAPDGQEARDAWELVQRTAEGLGLWQTPAANS